VIDLDPTVVKLARAHLGLRRAPGLGSRGWRRSTSSTRSRRTTRAAIAAGLAAAFPHVVALVAAPVLEKRRGGSVVLAGSARRAAARTLPRPSGRRQLTRRASHTEEMPALTGGTPPWRDA
jgi:hypothetical protein